MKKMMTIALSMLSLSAFSLTPIDSFVTEKIVGLNAGKIKIHSVELAPALIGYEIDDSQCQKKNERPGCESKDYVWSNENDSVLVKVIYENDKDLFRKGGGDKDARTSNFGMFLARFRLSEFSEAELATIESGLGELLFDATVSQITIPVQDKILDKEACKKEGYRPGKHMEDECRIFKPIIVSMNVGLLSVRKQ